nr:MAG TPA: hypothetical protein [Caudoviricetes sp.]
MQTWYKEICNTNNLKILYQVSCKKSRKVAQISAFRTCSNY